MSDDKVDISTMSPLSMLRLQSAINERLRELKLVRSANNPLGDLAETLFCTAFAWDQSPASEPAADAICALGHRYQIKARRIHSRNGSRQLSAIRNIDRKGFDFLAGVLFNEDYSIFRGALIPIGIVEGNSSFQSHTNSTLFHLRDSVWGIPGVVDVTATLKTYAERWT